jgi:hypothetical protein
VTPRDVFRRLLQLCALCLFACMGVRCDGCSCHESKTSSTSSGSQPAPGETYRGVGEPCSDDFIADTDTGWGCGGTPLEETCAEGLACCPTLGPWSQEPSYTCFASDRCATAGLGQWCDSRRDCADPHECVQNVCSGGVGTPCGEDIQCITRHCNVNGECGYPPLDAGPADSGSDAGDMGADAGVKDAGGDVQGQDADVDASTDA